MNWPEIDVKLFGHELEVNPHCATGNLDGLQFITLHFL